MLRATSLPTTSAPTLRYIQAEITFKTTLIELSAWQAIKTLRDKLQESRIASTPKRKFAFKKSVPQSGFESIPRDEVEDSTAQGQNLFKSNLNAISSSDVEPDAITRPAQGSNETTVLDAVELPPFESSDNQAIKVSSISSSRYTLSPVGLPQGSSASIMDIDRSLIDFVTSSTLAETLKAMTIKRVSKSLLLCGRIDGAVHITGVEHSTLVINSRQVRIHECKNCTLYLRCTSRPIIEDCSRIWFSPLPAVYVSNISIPDNWCTFSLIISIG